MEAGLGVRKQELPCRKKELGEQWERGQTVAEPREAEVWGQWW